MIFAVMAMTLTSLSGQEFNSQRPEKDKRLFISAAVEKEITEIAAKLQNPYLRWMFVNCFPNTLDTTVHLGEDGQGRSRTFVYTGDIPAMWLRDSGGQIWPYIHIASEDKELAEMIAGVIRCQFSLINTDPYANAFKELRFSRENGRLTHIAIRYVLLMDIGKKQEILLSLMKSGLRLSAIFSTLSNHSRRKKEKETIIF